MASSRGLHRDHIGPDIEIEIEIEVFMLKRAGVYCNATRKAADSDSMVLPRTAGE